MKRACSLAWALAVLLCQPVLPASGAEDVVRVSIRKDAPPFAFERSGGARAASTEDGAAGPVFPRHGGFVVDLCAEAFKRIGLSEHVEAVSVMVEERFPRLSGTVAGEPPIDVHCGPASITAARLEQHVFGVPVFLSGISYLTTPAAVDVGRDHGVVGVLMDTTALSGLGEGRVSELFPAHATVIMEELEGRTDPEKPAVRRFSGYESAYRALCSGEIIYLLGDFDIIVAINSTGIGVAKACDASINQITVSRETLSIVFSSQFLSDVTRRIDGLAPLEIYRRFQAQLFTFYQDGVIEEVFRSHFGDRRKSKELEAFFRGFRRVP